MSRGVLSWGRYDRLPELRLQCRACKPPAILARFCRRDIVDVDKNRLCKRAFILNKILIRIRNIVLAQTNEFYP